MYDQSLRMRSYRLLWEFDPWRNIWSGPGGRKWFTPLTGIGCVHHIEEKDCTARFATGAIREIPDWKINQVAPAHRLISRDRPTKTGRLWLCSPFFYVAALNVRIWRVVDGEWGGTISVEENFWKENKWLIFCEIIVLYSNREERCNIFLFVLTEFKDLLCSLDLNQYPSNLKEEKKLKENLNRFEPASFWAEFQPATTEL